MRRLVAKVHTSPDRDEGKRAGYSIRSLDLDRRIMSRLKPRATLAKKIADTALAQTKGKKEDDLFRTAAEDLGVEYDSDEQPSKGRQGRGVGRKRKEKEAREMSKSELGAMKAELRALLKQRINVGVSERYLTSGGVDVDELLKQKDVDGRQFLGTVHGLNFVD